MQLSELRIGNWVNFQGTQNCKISEEIMRMILDKKCQININDFSAIKLTEEWLKKFGIGVNGYYHFSIFIIEQEGEKFILKNEDLDIEVDYVHEFQNTCFYISKSELNET